MNEKELAIRIVQLGVVTQKQQAGKYTEANQDPAVNAAGNAAIATSLELLGQHGIVADVQPCLGAGGMGFSFLIRPELLGELHTDQAITRKVQALFSASQSETSATVAELLADCERV